MKLKLSKLPLENKKVLMRVDFNVPLHLDGTILDDSRIKAAIPSIRHILDRGGSIILMSHLGRPKGKVDLQASLSPCAKRLSDLLNYPVQMAPDSLGPNVDKMVNDLKPGSILLLENLRFHVGEEEPEKEPAFAAGLAKLGDCFVNDAFGAAHRPHASIFEITKYFPQKSAMGLLVENELHHLSKLLGNPSRPFHAIIGGSKVSSKAGIIKNLIPKLDALFIGGAMAFPFLKAQNISIGDSLCDSKDVALAKEILQLAEKHHLNIHFPSDLFAQKENIEPSLFMGSIPDGWRAMDIGPQTVQNWESLLKQASTIFWNGPLGVYEQPPFDLGTHQIAAALSNCPAQTVVGGGDSVAAIGQLNLSHRFAHLSTGGGASLEFLEFGHLPGIDALSDGC